MQIKHNKVVAVADSGDGKVSANAWNDGHVFTGTPNMIIGFDALGAATEIDPTSLSSGGIIDGDKGDIVVSSGVWSIDSGVISTFGRTLTDDADAATARTTLGLGTSSTQASTVFAQVANNLSDLASASTARTNLGLLRLIAFFFTTTPTSSEVLCLYVAADAFTIPANMSGSQVKVGTNPTATFAIDVQKNGSTIGTISIATSGTATLTTTSGAAKSIAAGDVIKFVAPSSADATIANVAINIKGTL